MKEKNPPCALCGHEMWIEPTGLGGGVYVCYRCCAKHLVDKLPATSRDPETAWKCPLCEKEVPRG